MFLPWLVAAATISMLFVAAPASADEPFDPENIIFPVDGAVTFSDDFGAPRSGGRTHEGNDLMTVDGKGVPVVTVAAGEVDWIGATCCYLSIDHGDGWETWYIHLNNDTPGTDDGEGWGIADGIAPGVTVTAGQLVGWIGDSGNAEASSPHLHFEIRFNGAAINPYPYLTAAQPGDPADPGDPVDPVDPVEPVPPAFEGTFRDDDDSVHQANIEIAADLGITKGCNPPLNDMFCPGGSITRGQMAAFLRRMLDLPAVATDYFADDSASVFEGDINALTEAGIAFGCDEENYCPGVPLLREEMAELLVRTFAPMHPEKYAAPDGADFFVDDDDSPFQESIDRLFHAGVTVGCAEEPAQYCPLNPVSRAQMATFLARAMGLGT